MLAEIEDGLVAAIKTSGLGQRLRAVGSLPDLTGDSLIGRFATDAPAIYVALSSFPVKNRGALLKFGVACVARNARGQKSARHGDGMMIGLMPMLDAAMALLDGLWIDGGGTAFEVTSCDLIQSEELYQRGVYAGVVQIESSALIVIDDLDLDGLADFVTFDAQYDIAPHDSSAEHDKWLQEPSDYDTSRPDMTDQINFRAR
jgi:hypothetical protein